MVFWEILNLSSDAKLDWSQYSVYTESIAGYEKVFKQDLDGKDGIGIDVGALTEIKTDTTGDQIQVSSSGTVHSWDGSDTANIVDVTDENGGTPSMVVADDWGELAASMLHPMQLSRSMEAHPQIITSLQSRFTRFIPTPVKPTS